MPNDAASVHQRVVLFGMACAFTETVAAALRAAPGVDLPAIVLPAGTATRPASAADVPLLRVPGRDGLRDPAFQDALAGIAPDLIVVACFPWLLPAWLRDLPRDGALNIHPSLLPDGRGPEPVFRALRRGLRETGVSIHRLDGGFDTGPVLARRRLAIPDDATLPSLEGDLAALGAEILLETLPGLRDGTVEARPQAAAGWLAPFPRAEDLVVPTSWPAERARRFIRAVTPVHSPVTVLVEATGQRLAVTSARVVPDGAAPPGPVRIEGAGATIRFTPGALLVRLATTARPLRLHAT